MRTFHVHLFFQAATEIYSNHRAANNKAHTIVAAFNLSGDCTFKKKKRNEQNPFEETEKQTKTNKNLSHD